MKRCRLVSVMVLCGGLGGLGEVLALNAVSGLAFVDVDGDGSYMVGAEVPLTGARVDLFADVDRDGNFEPGGDDGSALFRVITPADGGYLFAGLPDGLYFVRELRPSGYFQTTPPVLFLRLVDDMALTGRNFGNSAAGSIHGFKYVDVDANGAIDLASDQPLPGVSFTLTGTDGLGNVVNEVAVTDANGRFEFIGLLPSVDGAGSATGYTVTETVPAGAVATTPTVFTTDLSSGQELVALPGQAGLPAPLPVTIDFDSVDASRGAITGAAVAGYLAQFGITIDDITPSGGMQIVDDRIGFPSQVTRATTDFNVLWHDSPNNPYSYTVNFAAPQTSFTFVRPELFGATPSGLIVSPWRARAFDAAGALLDTVSEPQLAFFGSTLPVSFTLSGPGIAAVIFDRTTLNTIAGLNRVPTDNWEVEAPADGRREIVVGEALRFGNTVAGSIHGFKFADVDADGSYDPAIDRPLAGVSFTLTGTDGQGNVINLVAVSGVDGEYEFTGLLPSVSESGPASGYTVTETEPTGFSTTTPAISADLRSGEELVARPGQAELPISGPVTIDFDDVDASGGAVTGAAVAGYLAQFGITIDDITPSGGMQIVDDRIGFPSQVTRATTDFNVLWHDSPNNQYSYTVNFAAPQTSFTFVRPELFGATPSGLIVSPWRARAFDSTGALLDTVSEPQLAFFGSTPAVSFTLNGPGVAAVIFDRTTLNTIAGLNRVPSDNWEIEIPDDGRREIVVGDALRSGTAAGSIHGFKFVDWDGDGVYTVGIDCPLAGVSITLSGTDGLGNEVNEVAVTDANGRFEFTGLLPSVDGAGSATGYTVTETVPAGAVATTPTVFMTDLSSGQELVALPGQAGLPAPLPVTIDFDDVDASGAAITGTALASYFDQFGITIDGITPSGGMQIVDDRIGFPSQVTRATTDFNVLWHDSPNLPYSFTVNFAVPQASFTFVRPELFGATPSGLIVSPWRAPCSTP